jgi:hypothetical protein
MATQLEKTGLSLDVGLGDSLAISDRLAAANGEARARADEVRDTGMGALGAAARGAVGLGDSATGLSNAMEKALLLSGEAAGVSLSMGNLTKQAAQVSHHTFVHGPAFAMISCISIFLQSDQQHALLWT